ncbi:TNF receptor-associated factor 4, partial [Geodia barretti]
IITWFIPESIVEKLRGDIPHLILKKYTAVSLQIAGVKVYPPPQKSAAVSSPGPGPSAGGAAASVEKSPPQPKTEESRLSPEEDYPFVEKPTEDFFCPVTLGLLLQPHLTSCCGKHLSEESATRIQGEGGPCPLCKSPDWSTLLDKHVRRQVKELHVFCRHKEKGCRWKGELSHFTQHVQSCQFRNLPASTQVCTTGGVATFSTKPVSVFFLSTLLSPYLSLSAIVSLPLPREEQSSTMLLREEMWRQWRDSSPLLSISTPGLRM